MAIGDAENIARRIRGLLPWWFGPTAVASPRLSAVVAGAAAALADVFGLIDFARKQARIATATGAWLDFAAQDYFGRDFKRFKDEPDDAFRVRLRSELFRQCNTRAAIDSIIFDLTGQHPDIFEAWRAADTGGWGTPAFAWGAAGRWGSGGAPYEVIVTIPYPQGYGVPNRGGWGSLVGGWGVGNFSFISQDDTVGSGPTVTDILRAIDRVRAAGISIFVRFTDVGQA